MAGAAGGRGRWGRGPAGVGRSRPVSSKGSHRSVLPDGAHRRCERLAAHHPARPEQVVDEQHADQVVQVVEVHGEAAVSRLANGLRHGVDGQGQRERDHVDTRRHDLPDLRVPQVIEGIEMNCSCSSPPLVERRWLSAVSCPVAAHPVAVPGGDSASRRRTCLGRVRDDASVSRRKGRRSIESGWYDSSKNVPPSSSAVVARRSRIGSSGFTSQPFGARSSGQKDVGTPVEQHQHGDVTNAS